MVLTQQQVPACEVSVDEHAWRDTTAGVLNSLLECFDHCAKFDGPAWIKEEMNLVKELTQSSFQKAPEILKRYGFKPPTGMKFEKRVDVFVLEKQHHITEITSRLISSKAKRIPK